MAVLIFFIDLIVAFAWAKSIKAIASNKPVTAALFASFITLSGAITIISYTTNHWLLIPAVLGSGVGTYLSVCKNKY
jgi:tryptophan-rich sensory protein